MISGFNFMLRGKKPEEYRWMRRRRDELEYYRQQMRRIKTDPELQSSVHFDKWGTDMPKWYQKIGFILSTSDSESFHLSVVEGASSKAIPILLKREGAEEVYPKDWSYRTVEEASNNILKITEEGNFGKMAQSRFNYVIQNFSLEKIFCLWSKFI